MTTWHKNHSALDLQGTFMLNIAWCLGDATCIRHSFVFPLFLYGVHLPTQEPALGPGFTVLLWKTAMLLWPMAELSKVGGWVLARDAHARTQLWLFLFFHVREATRALHSRCGHCLEGLQISLGSQSQDSGQGRWTRWAWLHWGMLGAGREMAVWGEARGERTGKKRRWGSAWEGWLEGSTGKIGCLVLPLIWSSVLRLPTK